MFLPRSYHSHIQLPLGCSRSCSVTQHYTDFRPVLRTVLHAEGDFGIQFFIFLQRRSQIIILFLLTPFTVSSCKWICPRKCTCLQPILQHTSTYVLYGKPSATLSLQQHGVRFMTGHARQNTKSTYRREGLTGHFTKARKFASGC